MSFSPTQTALEGYRLIGRRPGAVVVWGLLFILGLVAFVAAALAAVWPMWLQVMLHPKEMPPSFLQDLARMALIAPLLMIGAVVYWSVLVCAVFRAVLRPQERGWASLRLGADELRQIGLQLLVMLLVLGGYIGAIVLGVVLAAVTPGDLWKGVVIVLYGVSVIALAIFLIVRLSLCAAMTFAERKIRLFESWSVTRGRFWPLLGFWLMVFLFAYIPSLLAQAPMQSAVQYLQAYAHGGAVTTAELSSLLPVMVVSGVISLIAWPVQFVVQHAPQAAAYMALADKGAGA